MHGTRPTTNGARGLEDADVMTRLRSPDGRSHSGPARTEQAALPGLVEVKRVGGVHRALFGGYVGAEPVAAFLAEALFLW